MNKKQKTQKFYIEHLVFKRNLLIQFYSGDEYTFFEVIDKMIKKYCDDLKPNYEHYKSPPERYTEKWNDLIYNFDKDEVEKNMVEIVDRNKSINFLSSEYETEFGDIINTIPKNDSEKIYLNFKK